LPPTSDLYGYLALLLFVFLPGLGLGELLGLWRKEDTLGERLGFALGLGLATDTIVMMIRTSGLTLGGLYLKGVDPATVYAVILAGAVLLVVPLVIRRRLSFAVKTAPADLMLFLAIVALAAMVYLHFQKYPIFPEYASQDFAAHVQFAQQLQAGTLTSIPAGILYYGIHYQLASALVLVGGEPLVTVQQTMGVLVIISPLIFYFAVSRVFGGRGPALVATAVYVLSGTIWFASVFNAGLFANFFGILASLFLLSVFADLSGQLRSKRLWLVFLLALVAAYFSHYTTATLIPALLVVPLAKFLKDRKDYARYLVPPVVSIAPAALAVVASPGLPGRVLDLAESGGGILIGSTPVANALSGLPVVSYMAFLTFDDLGFVFLLLFAAIGVCRVLRSRSLLPLVLIAWFLALLVAAPFNVSAWRFSLEALVPLTLLASYGVYSLLPRLKMVRKGKYAGYGRLAFVLFLLLVPLVALSWGQTSTVEAAADTQVFGTAQQQVYTAMYWLKDNTPPNSTYLSVSDPRFSYSAIIFGRTTLHGFIPDVAAALAIAKQNETQYIIVTRIVIGQAAHSPSQFPWDVFPASSTANLTLVYEDPDVRIFQVA